MPFVKTIQAKRYQHSLYQDRVLRNQYFGFETLLLQRRIFLMQIRSNRPMKCVIAINFENSYMNPSLLISCLAVFSKYLCLIILKTVHFSASFQRADKTLHILKDLSKCKCEQGQKLVPIHDKWKKIAASTNCTDFNIFFLENGSTLYL